MRITAALLVLALVDASVSAVITPGLVRVVVSVVVLIAGLAGCAWMWRAGRDET